MDGQRCDNCRHWDHDGETDIDESPLDVAPDDVQGLCRKKSPTAHAFAFMGAETGQPEVKSVTVWPETSASERCGEWEEAIPG